MPLYPAKNPVTHAQLLSYSPPTVEELQAEVGPNAGRHWAPIHHHDLIDTILDEASEMGLHPVAQAYDQSDDGHDLFGSIQFASDQSEQWSPVLGFRSSNLQRFALQGVTGANVMVCSNGMILGTFAFKAKHTNGLDLIDTIAAGLLVWEDQAAGLLAFVDALQAYHLTPADRDHLLRQGARDGAYAHAAIPKIEAVYDAYQGDGEGREPEFAPRTAWSLYNAVTEWAKTVRNPLRAERALYQMGRVLMGEVER